jgi:hypothetical protein
VFHFYLKINNIPHTCFIYFSLSTKSLIYHYFSSLCLDFSYAGHGSGSQFLQGDEIQKLKVQAVTFLFGCSSVTSKDLGGRVEPAGMWHFYHIASW